MYNRVLWFILVIFLMVSMAGCADLSSYDLSGQVELERKGDGFTYRRIYGYKKYGSEASGFIPEEDSGFSDIVLDILHRSLTGSPRGDVIRLSDLYPLLEFAKDIIVGQDTYTIKVEFTKKPPHTFNYLTILNSQGEEVPITIIEKKTKINGDRVNLTKDTYRAWHEGYGLVSFIEPISRNEYLLEISFSLEGIPERKSGEGKDEHVVESARIEISISSHIGNSSYFQGLYILGKKKTVKVYLLDWNLDGVFTDEDRVWIDYGKKKYLPLNEKFKLGKDKKQKEYIMNLKPGDDEGDKYILNIERTDI